MLLAESFLYYLVFLGMDRAVGYILKRNVSAADGNVIHCFCNLPACIATSYMCKSETNENGCFKKYNSISQHYTHGCLELAAKPTLCAKNLESSITLSPDRRNVYECCYTDMCNSESSEKQLKTIQSADIHINESDQEKIKEILSFENINRISSPNYYSNSETWFRAMLIAVPICGVLILCMLIFVAIRILKSDVPDNRGVSSRLIKRKHENSTAKNDNYSLSSVPRTWSSGCCFTECRILDRKFFFILKPQNKSKNTKYMYTSNGTRGNKNCRTASTVPDKFSRPTFNILKLPHKFNEFKHKNDKNVNAGNNKNYKIIIPVTTLDSNLNGNCKNNFSRSQTDTFFRNS